MSLYDRDDPPGSGGGGEGGKPGRGPRCPICAKPTIPHHRPFCSRRCADIDLHRWLAGVYRVPTNEPPDPDENEGKG